MDLGKQLITLTMAFLLSTLVGCGGGSSGNDTGSDVIGAPQQPDQPQVPGQPQVPDNPEGPDQPSQPGNNTSISGVLIPSAGVVIDSDLNDPNTPFTDNLSNPQRIDNLATVQGFATATGTGNSGDRFASQIDDMDIYQVSLQAGQILQMQVIDYDQFDLSLPLSGDLDLMLLDSNIEVVASSLNEGEFEEVVVPASGEYYIGVIAFSGSSKYLLHLLPPQNALPATTLPDFIPDEVIVQFATSGQSRNLQRQDGTLSQLSLNHPGVKRPALSKVTRTASPLRRKASTSPGWDWLKNTNPHSYAKLQTLLDIKTLRNREDVLLAEPNYRYQALQVPNDEHYHLQWHYPLINLPQAWDITTGTRSGNPVVVAVLDTGVVMNHPDLAGQLTAGFDFISDIENALDGDGLDANPDDPGDSPERGKSSWHGTHVAGTIAAATNNAAGLSGIAWDARIMPIRVLGLKGGSDYDIAQGMLYAAGLPNDSNRVPSRKADIINMSLGAVGGSSTFMQQIINQVRATGTITVVSAGNSGTNELAYPAAYDGVISVAAIDMRKQRALYSTFNQAVDVTAPGGDLSQDRNGDGYADGVLSLIADDTSGTRRATFSFQQGTSMSAPHVSGVLALMKAVYPALTPDDVDLLLRTGEITEDLGSNGWDREHGHGMIDALKAVRAAQRLANGDQSPVDTAPILLATPAQISLGLSTSSTLTISNQGGGTPTLSGYATDADWLTLSTVNVDAQGLGVYRVTADRSTLTNGQHQGTLRLRFNQNQVVDVVVTVQKGTLSNATGDMATQYLLLLDPDTLTTIDQALPQFSGGQWTFRFSDVAPGDYVIFSGSDIDNDGVVCQSGESCGGYPTINNPQTLTVAGQPLQGLQIPVDLLGALPGTLSAQASTAASTSYSGSGLKRRLPE